MFYVALNMKLKKGDIVAARPWDCEGIEYPWGYKAEDIQADRPRSTRRVSIAPDALGMILEIGADVDDFDKHCILLINERLLSVPIRFLHSVA
jgi:hypothetical protein